MLTARLFSVVLLLSGCAGQHSADDTILDMAIYVIPSELGGCEVRVTGVDKKDRGVKKVEIHERPPLL